jgi:transcriptional regulator with XRE-family HTH domain
MNKTIYSKEHQYIVKKLKEARKEAGLSQVQVAKILHRTQSYISKIESGQRKIDLIQLKQFAKIYKKDLNFFIYENRKN